MNIILSSVYNENLLAHEYRKQDIEFRLDLSGDLDSVQYDRLTPNIILTHRTTDPNSTIFAKMLATKCTIDMDHAQYAEYEGKIDPARLILSAHFTDFDEAAFINFLDTPIQAKSYKLIFNAQSFAEIVACAELIKARPHRKYIFNVLGKWAFFQRVLADEFYSEAAYFAEEEPIEPTQPAFVQLAAIIHAANIQNIVLLIGKGDLSKSGSMNWGNNFTENMYHIANPDPEDKDLKDLQVPHEMRFTYLSAPILDLVELHEVINWLQNREPAYRVIGLAIASGFKHEMARYVNSHRHSINTLTFWQENTAGAKYHAGFKCFVKSANTDITALNTILPRFEVSKDDSILIYGSGDCAYSFAAHLKRLGYTQITLNARNEEKLQELSHRLNLPIGNPPKCKLLINATPLGINETDDISCLPDFDYLIDLALSGFNISQLSQFASDDFLNSIDGQLFWITQHNFQRQEMSAALNHMIESEYSTF